MLTRYQGLFTFIVAIYALVAEKAPACHRAYNYWAIISLDALMAIFWLSSMGANAALRASFVYSVDAECYSDGSALNSGHCITSKRDGLDKRAGAVATNAGLAEMSAIAGLSALEMWVPVTLYIQSLAADMGPLGSFSSEPLHTWLIKCGCTTRRSPMLMLLPITRVSR